MRPSLIVCVIQVGLTATSPIISTSLAQERKVQTPYTISPAEQQMVALGEQRDVNIVIDATNVPLNTPIGQPPEYKSTVKAHSILVPLAQQFQWNTYNLTPNTYLFWHEPDPEQMVSAISKGQGYGSEKGILPPLALTALLRDYLEKNGGAKTGSTYKFNYSQAPTQLQNQLAAQVVEKVVNGFNSRNYLDFWLREEIWSNARIVYSPPNPLVKGTVPNLFAMSWIRTPYGVVRLNLNLRRGVGSARPDQEAALREAGIYLGGADKNISEGKIQLLPIEAKGPAQEQVTTNAEVTPIIFPDILRESGTAGDTIKSRVVSASLPSDEKLLKPLNLKATRISLFQLTSRLAQEAGIQIHIDEKVDAKSLFVSLYTKNLSTRDIMLCISRLYGLAWSKADESYNLSNAQVIPLEQDILKIGNPTWYRFREWNVDFISQEDQNFNDMARQIVDETGPSIFKFPGVPFKSLSPDFQQKIREHPRRWILRNIVLSQASAFEWQGEFVLEYNPTTGTLYAKSDRGTIPMQLAPLAALPPAEPKPVSVQPAEAQ